MWVPAEEPRGTPAATHVLDWSHVWDPILFNVPQMSEQSKGGGREWKKWKNLNKRISGGTQSTTSVLLHLCLSSSAPPSFFFHLIFLLLLSSDGNLICESGGAALWVRVDSVLITCPPPPSPSCRFSSTETSAKLLLSFSSLSNGR